VRLHRHIIVTVTSVNGLYKHILAKDKSPVSEGEEHRVKNGDEVDESHKSQLKSEYEVYLLNYTIKIFLNFKNLNWIIEGFVRF